MKVIRVGHCCLLAVLAISAFAAASASAAVYDVKALPEAGRCVKVPTGSGIYRGGGCINKALPGKGTFEWAPASVTEKLKFSGSGAESILATVGHPTIKCVAANITGEYTGAKTATVEIEFQACINSLEQQCQSSQQNKSEIKTLPLEAELGFIRNEVIEGKKIVVVGLDLKATPPLTNLVTYECGNVTESAQLEGSVIGKIAPINKMTTVQKLVYFVKKSTGAQVPEKFESGLKDTLSTTFQTGLETTTAPTTLFIKEEIGSNEVPIEIRGTEN